MNAFFATKDVERIYNVSHQTVKNWCDEFAGYLSATAVPIPGRKRVFTTDDLQVFALVSEYGRMGLRYDDAHVALKSGQRSVIPSNESEMTAQPPAALLVRYQEEIVSVKQQLEVIKTERDHAVGKVELLQAMLDQREEQVRELYKQIARLEAGQPPK